MGVGGGTLSVGYDGYFSDDLDENSVSARATWPFSTNGW